VESFILLPVVTISGSLAGIPAGGQIAATSQVVFSQKLNIEEVALGTAEEGKDFARLHEEEMAMKAEAIDEYFRSRGMPLAGTGRKMVEEAEKNDLDWRLLAAIAARESTGGKFACKKVKHNPFGWNSCKTGFESTEKAIETVGRNLGGNNPKTKRHYADKTTEGILKAYNPPHVVPNYAAQVMRIMNVIGPDEVTLAST